MEHPKSLAAKPGKSTKSRQPSDRLSEDFWRLVNEYDIDQPFCQSVAPGTQFAEAVLLTLEQTN